MNTSTASIEDRENPFTDTILGQVDVRVDLVRMDVYRLFIESKGVDDLYLEEIFNTFIAVAQEALNFAIYDKDGMLLFHLVNDIKYYDYFTTELRKKENINAAFDLFPDILNGKYRILVLHMNTKNEDRSKWFESISFNSDWNNEESIKEFPKLPISSRKNYLERCIWRFFYAPWDGFNTLLKEQAKDAITTSILRLSKNFGSTWPPNIEHMSNELTSIPFPNANGPDSWHKKMQQIFYPLLRDSVYGLSAQHLLMHAGNRKNTDDAAIHVPNMLIAYRSFTRKADAPRFNLPSNKKARGREFSQGYLYDTQFLIPDKIGSNNNPIWDLLETLQNDSEFLGKNKNKNLYENRVEKSKRTRRLFRNIFSEVLDESQLPERFMNNKDDVTKGVTHNAFRYLTQKLDKEFWKLISTNDGILECIDILRSPVGDGVRSLVDSAYYTGLIHKNFVLRYAGLDRVRGLSDTPDILEIDKYLSENRSDLLRIVMLFYLLSEMVNWNGQIKDFDPRKVAAVLVPIKMRGSVWAVTIHATYIKNEEDNFKNVPYWISYYHLSTTLKIKNQQFFDRILWDNVQNRVSQCIEKSMNVFQGVQNFRRAMEKFNLKMLGEQRLVPYALPQILFSEDEDKVAGYVHLNGIDGELYKMPWKIADNNFFLAAQDWNRVGTRSFQLAIELGLSQGFKNTNEFIGDPNLGRE